MDDIFDTDGPPGERFPGDRPFRSQKELEAENERLREENELLAELLTGPYDGGSGELSEESTGAGPVLVRQRFVISEEAIDLFEALPEAFTLDEALDRAEGLGQTSAEAARHLRAYLAERMAVQEGERFVKTGRKPYF